MHIPGSRLQENLNILCVWCVGGWDGWGGRGEGHWVTGHNNFCFQKIHDVELSSARSQNFEMPYIKRKQEILYVDG